LTFDGLDEGRQGEVEILVRDALVAFKAAIEFGVRLWRTIGQEPAVLPFAVADLSRIVGTPTLTLFLNKDVPEYS
jgi:hypothetical protein